MARGAGARGHYPGILTHITHITHTYPAARPACPVSATPDPRRMATARLSKNAAKYLLAAVNVFAQQDSRGWLLDPIGFSPASFPLQGLALRRVEMMLEASGCRM
jgi:hypothetical protein